MKLKKLKKLWGERKKIWREYRTAFLIEIIFLTNILSQINKRIFCVSIHRNSNANRIKETIKMPLIPIVIFK